MRRLLVTILFCLTLPALLTAGQMGGKQYFELREYRLKSLDYAAKVDDYLTVYPSLEAKAEAWKKFPKHPEWKKLTAIPKFKGSVSKSHKWVLAPVPGSQL